MILHLLIIGILINATLGSNQNEHDKMEENLQSLLPKDIVNIKNKEMLRKTENVTRRFFFNLFGATTTTTTTANPFREIYYDLKSILDNLDGIADRLARILRSVTTIGRQLPNRLKKFKKVRPKRDTDQISEMSNVTDRIQPDKLTEINGRRMNTPKLNLIKAKLLNYLEETFHDIDEKLESLERIKQLYFNNDPYKVGYVVANLDTLAVNMRNIKDDVRRNEELWGEEEILNVYDRLKTTQNVINNLSNTLRVINKE